MNQIPLALYLHIPWCVKKCPYCDFNSHEKRGELPEQQYVQALIENLDRVAHYAKNREIISVFIGGGTPSLFSANAYQTLFNEIQQRIKFCDDVEITLEANPGTVDEQHFAGYRQAGINRLSIGAQSFQNEKLKKLGRIHQANDVERAVNIARAAGFDNFNIDLMFGLPDQTINEALHDLECAIKLNPTHLSWYQLTLEPQTFFYKHPPKLPTDDLIWDMQVSGQEFIQQHGFAQYEISAYAKPDRQCRHNLNYWQFGDYIGLGAGAHSKISDLENNRIVRFENIKNPKMFQLRHRESSKRSTHEKEWIATVEDSLAMTNHIIGENLVFEFMMNALRLNRAIPINLFNARTGLNISIIENKLTKARELDLIQIDNKNLQVTKKGHQYLNELLEIFL